MLFIGEKMKNVSTNDLIQDATAEIEKLAPKNSHLEVDIKEDSSGVYRTNLILVTKYRTYFAGKEDIFMVKSFKKALKALKSQLSKKQQIHTTVNFYKTKLDA
jgi:hypothetical protein